MPDEPYSLADLARLADVTPRTIRYYVAQGLLPAPQAAGPATRYSEGHLLRLRLIRRLQRDHLPLAEIRARLEQLGDDEVRVIVEESAPPAHAPADTLAFVQALMTRSGVQPRVADAAAPSMLRAALRYEPVAPDEFRVPGSPLPDAQPSQPTMPAQLPASPPATGTPRTGVGGRTTWERVVLAPDVELHRRRPLDRRTAKRVESLISIARELFEDEA